MQAKAGQQYCTLLESIETMQLQVKTRYKKKTVVQTERKTRFEQRHNARYNRCESRKHMQMKKKSREKNRLTTMEVL